jgi:hypothetical protein
MRRKISNIRQCPPPMQSRNDVTNEWKEANGYKLLGRTRKQNSIREKMLKTGKQDDDASNHSPHPCISHPIINSPGIVFPMPHIIKEISKNGEEV